MPRVLGIIAEYNPFHNGHLYHLAQSKQLSNSDYTVCVMSGNFAQRGNTSIVNKWVKTEMALLNGIDLVLELPTVYATSSAENFAEGAIKLLDSLKIVNTVSFGSELCDIDLLNKVASILYEEPKEYVAILSHELKKGLSFPKARENALMMYLNDITKYSNILSKPNNILAIEYLKAMKKYKSRMRPLAVKREKVYYHDVCVVDEYASATAIRELIKAKDFKEIRRVMPTRSYQLLREEFKKGNYIIDISKYEKEILYALRKMTVSQIADLPDVSEGLENSLKNAANSCNNLVDLINIVKSKRYTLSRIQRILIYALLGISKKDMAISRKISPYVRVLGMNDKGRYLLSSIAKANPKLSIVTSVKKFMDQCTNKNLKEMMEKDIFATNVYTLGYEYDSWANLDYTNKLITF